MDREKVIKELEELCEYLFHEYEICYHGDKEDIYNRFLIADNALALLKEQGAVEPYSMNAERTYGICHKCGKIVFRYGNVEENHYCGICGQAVKWE